ncbi:hypothetical protein ACFLQO_00120 [Candidatus Aenigmatarchaeota archaeon]
MAMEIFTHMIPFLFVLAVVYGGLDFSGVFNKNSVKGIISLAIALFALTYVPVLDFIYGILPYAVVLLIFLFFLAFLNNLVSGGGKTGGEKKPFKDWSLLMIVIVLVLLFMSSYGEDLVGEFLPSMPIENLMYGVGLVLILLIFYAVYRNWSGNGE